MIYNVKVKNSKWYNTNWTSQFTWLHSPSTKF